MSSLPRVRAPELVGRGGWLNTGGRELTLVGLRGKIVLLDFWTFCCINCLHVLDELREVEADYADVLVTVGVHSPKFVHEADHAAVLAAVERYGVHHPVLDDPDLVTWQAYAVRAWPTLVVVDPEGYVVAQMSGEGHGHGLRSLLEELIAEHEVKGTLHRGAGPYVAPQPRPSTLRFPAKAVRLPGETFLVADAGHHQLVEVAADLETAIRRVGTGHPGLVDGDANAASFNEPNGLCLLPPEVASWCGYDVVVADTVNHALRGVRLRDGAVTTVAGIGRQWMHGDPQPMSADPAVAMSSPWDVVWLPGWDEVAVAMAGVHQIWSFDPVTPSLSVRVGTTNEGLRDGAPDEAWLAQPSGLAVERGGDGARLWFVDSETSSLRQLAHGAVTTRVGTGLFEFGHVDGPVESALLQHPLGVTVLPDQSIAVSDTYNGALRRLDPRTAEVTTLATGLSEPSGAVVDGDTLVVVESAAHRLVRVRLPEEALVIDPRAHRTRREPTEVRSGAFTLRVVFEPPTGQKLDDRYGPSTRLLVSASPPEILVDGAGSDACLSRDLQLAADVPEGVLHVAAFAASCDDDALVEFPACHVHQQDWGIPLRLGAVGSTELTLHLRGRTEGLAAEREGAETPS